MQIWIRILRSFGPPGRENFGEFPALRDPSVAAVIKIPRNMSKHFQTFPRNIQMRLLRLEAKNRVEISQRHWSVAPSTWSFPKGKTPLSPSRSPCLPTLNQPIGASGASGTSGTFAPIGPIFGHSSVGIGHVNIFHKHGGYNIVRAYATSALRHATLKDNFDNVAGVISTFHPVDGNAD